MTHNGSTAGHQLCSIADDLVNSLQQTFINPGTARSTCSSSSSSSSSSTSSSFSSSFCSSNNDVNSIGNNNNNGSGMGAHHLATIYDFHTSGGPGSLDNSSGSSTTSSSDLVFNSLFQPSSNAGASQFDQKLIFSALANSADLGSSSSTTTASSAANDFYYFANSGTHATAGTNSFM